jgi:uncharacterized protein YqcC (DUF446 family)
VCSTNLAARVAAKLEEIERAMHAAGLWQESPLQPDQLEFEAAFGADKLAFSQWLQFVFIPRVREAIASARFPKSSSVGVQAIREFDTYSDAAHLVTLLNEFDQLFEGHEQP